MRLIVAQLLDRGWDAHWVLAQPMYVLAGMMSALTRHARNSSAHKQSETGASTQRYVVSREAREARKAKQKTE